MKRLFAVLVPCFVILSIGCQSVRQPVHREMGAGQVKVWHVVIVRLNDPGDAEALRKVIDASKSFRQIPGVQVVYVGKNIPGTRPHQDSSFDIGLVMGFKNKEDMAAYVAHPMHVKAVNEVLKPLAKDFTSYDFTNE